VSWWSTIDSIFCREMVTAECYQELFINEFYVIIVSWWRALLESVRCARGTYSIFSIASSKNILLLLYYFLKVVALHCSDLTPPDIFVSGDFWKRISTMKPAQIRWTGTKYSAVHQAWQKEVFIGSHQTQKDCEGEASTSVYSFPFMSM